MAVFWCWWCYSMVLVVPLWCWWCLSGADGASLVLVVVLPGGAGRIFPADHPGGHAQSSSVRRAVLLQNQGFGVKFKDAIALIINYLGAPFG